MFFDLDGTPLRLVGAVHDVTDHGPEAARLAQVLDGAHAAFVSMDATGMITEFNRAAEEMFGWPRGAVIGRELLSVIAPHGEREATRRDLRRSVSDDPVVDLDRRLEFDAEHRDGGGSRVGSRSRGPRSTASRSSTRSSATSPISGATSPNMTT